MENYQNNLEDKSEKNVQLNIKMYVELMKRKYSMQAINCTPLFFIIGLLNLSPHTRTFLLSISK